MSQVCDSDGINFDYRRGYNAALRFHQERDMERERRLMESEEKVRQLETQIANLERRYVYPT